MIRNPAEREEMIRLLQGSLAGIEHKTTVERLGGMIMNGEDLIQIDNDSHLAEGGGIREVQTFKIRVYTCGCRADGRTNFGGIDYRGNVACSRHFWRCLDCLRPLSILTVRTINGVAYCRRCYRIEKLKRFFGLK
jgi:hypothetical protein